MSIFKTLLTKITGFWQTDVTCVWTSKVIQSFTPIIKLGRARTIFNITQIVFV